VVYHVGGATLKKENPQKTYLNFRNNLTMMLKNMPFPKLIPIIFLRLCLDGLAALFLWKKNGFSHLWAILRAHFGFYKQAPTTYKLRQKSQKKDFYQSSFIIFKHFLK
jgi:hypothetical protein